MALQRFKHYALTHKRKTLGLLLGLLVINIFVMAFSAGLLVQANHEFNIDSEEFFDSCSCDSLSAVYYFYSDERGETGEFLNRDLPLYSDRVFCPHPWSSLRVDKTGCGMVEGVVCGFPPNTNKEDVVRQWS